MERARAAMAHRGGTRALRVEVVLPRRAGDDLPVLGHSQAFRVGLIVFHVITALVRGRTIMPEIEENANLCTRPVHLALPCR